MSIIQEYNKNYRPPKPGDPISVIGNRSLPLLADKTAVASIPMIGYTPKNLGEDLEADRMQRTFPIQNKYHFYGKSNKEIREELLRLIKEENVKASPVDMQMIQEVLYPPEENAYLREMRLNNFKQKFYRNNPEWETEEKEWEKRKKGIN